MVKTLILPFNDRWVDWPWCCKRGTFRDFEFWIGKSKRRIFLEGFGSNFSLQKSCIIGCFGKFQAAEQVCIVLFFIFGQICERSFFHRFFFSNSDFVK